MKRSTQHRVKHLSDLISEIDRVFIVEEAALFRRSMVSAESDSIDYMLYSDCQLMSLPVDELHEITDIEVMERIVRIKQTKKYAENENYTLSDFQKNILFKYNRQKKDILLTQRDIKAITEMLVDISDYRVEIRINHNTEFADKYNFDKSRYIDLIRNLNTFEPIILKRSFNSSNLSGVIYEYKPKKPLYFVSGGRITHDVRIRVKIDIKKLRRSVYHTMAYISCHKKTVKRKRR